MVPMYGYLLVMAVQGFNRFRVILPLLYLLLVYLSRKEKNGLDVDGRRCDGSVARVFPTQNYRPHGAKRGAHSDIAGVANI